MPKVFERFQPAFLCRFHDAVQYRRNRKGKQSETVRILRVSSGRNPGTYGRYRPVIPGTIIALVTGASGKNQKTKVNVSRESGIYLSRYLIWCVYGHMQHSYYFTYMEYGLLTIQYPERSWQLLRCPQIYWGSEVGCISRV